ncbi:hypothetical protein V6N12_055212, partial [Hibiscus sabdariffa]
LSEWDLVGDKTSNSSVSILVESSKVGVCAVEAELSTFLFLALEASGMLAAGVSALGEV